MKGRLKHLILRNSFALSITQKLRGMTDNNCMRIIFEILLAPLGEIKYLFFNTHENADLEFKHKLGISLIIKNEASYIREWIEFHKNLGFSKFIIYDNESTDNLRMVISDYIESGIVDFYSFAGKKRQVDAYNHTIHNYYRDIEYIAIIDADEFIVPSKPEIDIYTTIKELFKSNVYIGGITINWLCFGSSGLLKKPEGLVIENYIKRSLTNFEANRNYKTIVNPRKVFSFTSPHYPIYAKNYFSVNTSCEKTSKEKIDGVYDKLRINHYFTKSQEEYIAKMNRGKADRNDKRSIDEFYKHDRNDEIDLTATKYATIINERLKNEK